MWNHVPDMAERMRSRGIEWPPLDRREAGDLIAFLFTVGYFDRTPDIEVGWRLFTDKGCIQCHQVGNVGGVVGPILDAYGLFGSPIHVAASMWNHGPAMSEAFEARGMDRPTFDGDELVDLIGYVQSASKWVADLPMYVLPGDADEGRRRFAERGCSSCHSVGGGGGGPGPDLALRAGGRSLSMFASEMWNKQPAMIRAMRYRGIEVPSLDPEEMADIVAYLYSVRYFADAGSPDRGRMSLRDKGCLECHLGTGGDTDAPRDLSRVDPLTSPAEVISVLWNHALISDTQDSADRWPSFTASEIADLSAYLQTPRFSP
jgi:mono/diheme cytochrome c family protein